MGCYAIKQARALGMGVMHDSTLVEGGFIVRDEEEPETEETLRIRQGIMPQPVALFKAMEESMKAAASQNLIGLKSRRVLQAEAGQRSKAADKAKQKGKRLGEQAVGAQGRRLLLGVMLELPRIEEEGINAEICDTRPRSVVKPHTAKCYGGDGAEGGGGGRGEGGREETVRVKLY